MAGASVLSQEAGQRQDARATSSTLRRHPWAAAGGIAIILACILAYIWTRPRPAPKVSNYARVGKRLAVGGPRGTACHNLAQAARRAAEDRKAPQRTIEGCNVAKQSNYDMAARKAPQRTVEGCNPHFPGEQVRTIGRHAEKAEPILQELQPS